MRIIISFCWLLWGIGWINNPLKAANVYTEHQQPDASSQDSAGGIARQSALAIEYQIYQAASVEQTNSLLFKKAVLLKAQQNFGEALVQLKRINTEAELPDSIRYKLLYEQALLSYLNQQYTQASYYLLQMHNELLDSNLIKQCLLLQCLCSIQNEEWEQMKVLAAQYLQQREAIAEFEKIKVPKHRSSKIAAVLSAIVPGLGNVYARNMRLGLLNLVSFSAVGLATAWHINEGYIAIPAISGLGLALRFYVGSIKTSRQSALDYNTKQMERYKQQLVRCLLNRQ